MDLNRYVALQISKDEEELARKRMEVKRGLPLQDLSGKRGFPDDPRQAANEKMQAEVQLPMLLFCCIHLTGAPGM